MIRTLVIAALSAADVKHFMVLALRGAPRFDQRIKFITGGLAAAPSFSERGAEGNKGRD